MICNIQDPITHQDYTRDPRNIARKAVSYMRNTGLADQCLLAPELEFFVFDNVRFEQRGHEAFLSRRFGRRGLEPGPRRIAEPGLQAGRLAWAISRVRPPTAWSTSAPRWPSGWPNAASPRPPISTKSPPAANARSTWFPSRWCESADQVVLAKYIIRNVARRNGKTATFMPKPLFGDNGSGMHTHLTLWKDDQPLLAGQGYAGL